MRDGGPAVRQQQIIDAARHILETHGEDGLTMRRLAEALGIRAPSLYKHFPDKAAVEAALMQIGLQEAGVAMEPALRAPNALEAVAAAYRRFAIEHPHLYRLMTTRPLPREQIPVEVVSAAAAPLMAAVGGDLDRTRAVWGLAHGLVLLELNGRLPDNADIDAAWRVGLHAFNKQPRKGRTR